MHSKNLRTYLDSATGIAALLPQAERLIELRRIYKEIVPQQLLRASSIVNYKQENVVIFAENNAIAAKIKLLSPRLVNDFSKRGIKVTGIRLEVQPRQNPLEAVAGKHARLSPAGAESLDALAKRLPDSKLKQALAELAARGASEHDRDQAFQGEQDQEHQGKVST
ncbi:MAG: DciA family protein [Proteobacteria bacterium]|nr:DciA family protein [Pseudomonadota bacterium]